MIVELLHGGLHLRRHLEAATATAATSVATAATATAACGVLEHGSSLFVQFVLKSSYLGLLLVGHRKITLNVGSVRKLGGSQRAALSKSATALAAAATTAATAAALGKD